MGIIDKAVAAVSAAPGLNVSSSPMDATNLTNKIITVVGIVGGLLAFVYLVYGGFLYLTAAGNAEQAKKGGQAIINAIIGIIVIFLAYGLVTFVTTSLGT